MTLSDHFAVSCVALNMLMLRKKGMRCLVLFIITLVYYIELQYKILSGRVCSICERKFKIKSELRLHVNTIHEGKGFKCQFCNNTFKSKSSKNLHVRKVHEGFKPEPQKCSQCEKIYSSASALKLHVRAVHEKKRPYACHLCDLSFGQSGNLKIHLKGKHKEFSFTGGIKNGSFLPEWIEFQFSSFPNKVYQFETLKLHTKDEPWNVKQLTGGFLSKNIIIPKE